MKNGEQRTSRLSIKRGVYGRSKVKAFTVLQDYKGRWLSTRFLCVTTGIPYHSLARHLPRWWDFGYVERRPYTGLGDYEYRARKKANTWLSVAASHLLKFGMCWSKLYNWQKMIGPDFDRMLTLLFTQFIPAFSEAINVFKKAGLGFPNRSLNSHIPVNIDFTLFR